MIIIVLWIIRLLINSLGRQAFMTFHDVTNYIYYSLIIWCEHKTIYRPCIHNRQMYNKLKHMSM